MFLSLIKFFHGFLRIQLSGYSPERFLNLCSNHNILIWDLTNYGDGYEFNISIHGYRQLKPLLKKKCGDLVKEGDTIALIYANDMKKAETAKQQILDAYMIGDTQPAQSVMIKAVID